MKKALCLFVTTVCVGILAAAPPVAAAGDEALQGSKTSAALFELKMRVLEGVRERSAEPARPVTSSFLRFLNFVNFDLEQDLAAEQQIKKVYSLKDVSLLTEAVLVWEKGKPERAFHMFRLNGQEYLVMVTPGRPADRNRFRIEVYEQSRDKKTSLLDTEFSLPEKKAAVFGFENTELKPYFISLRVIRWSGETEAVGAAVEEGRAGASGGAPWSGGSRMIKPPKLVKEVAPVYPADARKAGIEGVVIMEATTDLYGRVAGVKVLRSIPALDQAAIDALKQWVYEPMVIDGKPHAVTFTVTVKFSLDESKKPVVGGVSGGIVGGVSTGVEGGVTGGVVGGIVGGIQGGVEGAQDLKKFERDAVRAVGGIEPPKLVKKVNPVYPETARRDRVEGKVILEAKADEQGNVIDTRVLRSIPSLDQAAVDAIRQWKYEPMIIDGKPHKIIFTVTVRFKLEEGDSVKTLDEFAKGAIRAEKDISPPKLIKEVAPVFPEAARAAAVDGVVILGVKTGVEGKVEDAMVLRSIPLLDQAAIDAVRQWIYEPLVLDGKAVPVVFTVTVRFRLK